MKLPNTMVKTRTKMHNPEICSYISVICFTQYSIRVDKAWTAMFILYMKNKETKKLGKKLKTRQVYLRWNTNLYRQELQKISRYQSQTRAIEQSRPASFMKTMNFTSSHAPLNRSTKIKKNKVLDNRKALSWIFFLFPTLRMFRPSTRELMPILWHDTSLDLLFHFHWYL